MRKHVQSVAYKLEMRNVHAVVSFKDNHHNRLDWPTSLVGSSDFCAVGCGSI